jgi:hypothetical protein
MICTIPTLNINVDDCVGDSLGKHNYNVLTLDTNVCNLSSLLFNNPDNLSSFFVTFSSVINNILSISDYAENKVNEILVSTTTVNLLSSYWQKNEFSVQYPINGSKLYGRNFLDAPSITADNLDQINDFIDKKLKILALRYLNKEFPAKNFTDNTVVNVIFFLYNVNPNPANIDNLTQSSIVPKNFNYKQRLIKAQYVRDSIYLRTSVTLKFIGTNVNNLWTYFDSIIGDYGLATNTTTSTIKPAVVVAGKCFPIKFNTWYNVDDYFSAIAYSHGRNHKRKALRKFGTLTVSFSSRTGIQKFSHKAGQNGGCDTYLSWDQNNVIASEKNPIDNSITNIWTRPFIDVPAGEIPFVKFKFTRDNRALTYYACASDKVVM